MSIVRALARLRTIFVHDLRAREDVHAVERLVEHHQLCASRG